MQERYNPAEIETRWQQFWEERGTFRVDEDPAAHKFYLLEMFPYPSGRIHMGHVRNYSIGDVVARFKRLQGRNVLHPMGWDAFGMPAENAAIQHGTHPAKWTYENIANMRVQLKKMGLSYDWSRELATCDVDYYKWEQLVFLRMLEKGLAYKKSSTVNWCPSCQTVLANEQVEDNCCWRCDSEVQAKELEQWFFRITDYAEELLAETWNLPGWPEPVLTMQRNWIGKSTGCEIDFPVAGRELAIKVFTTRQDTLFGATFMSLAPEHPLALELTSAEQRPAVEAFIAQVRRQDKARRTSDDFEKEGVFTGAFCVNPVTGRQDAGLPRQLRADGIRHRGGDGGADPRPARLRIRPQVRPAPAGGHPARRGRSRPGDDDRGLDRPRHPGQLRTLRRSRQRGRQGGDRRPTWPPKGSARRPSTGGCATGASRASVTGERRFPSSTATAAGWCRCRKPICRWCCRPTSSSPARGAARWPSPPPSYEVACPRCGGAARRETDTFDTFVESSWYFARYACPRVRRCAPR